MTVHGRSGWSVGWLVFGLVTALVLGGCSGETDRPSGSDRPSGPASAGSTPSPGSSPSPGDRPPPVGAPASPARWVPAPGTAWQWQLTTPVNQSIDVPVYDIDGFENSAAVVKALKAKGRRVICYINVGAAENFRPDYRKFPAELLGRSNGWPGERWVDVRRLDALKPLIAARFDMCRAKGFDAVEPDLMEHFTNNTGFKVSAAEQLRFNRLVAALAHERGLSVGLKNDASQAAELVGDFDFAVVEECAEYDECEEYSPFIAAGKAVFHAEYALRNPQFCAEANRLRFSSMRKRLALDAARWPC